MRYPEERAAYFAGETEHICGDGVRALFRLKDSGEKIPLLAEVLKSTRSPTCISITAMNRIWKTRSLP